jgi:hypothetical protein
MKKWINKQSIVMFIFGIMISSTSFVVATNIVTNPNPFPVIKDGKEVNVEGYNINGSTYLKLRDMAGLVDTNVEFKDKIIYVGEIENITPTPIATTSIIQVTNNISIPTPKPPEVSLRPSISGEFIYNINGADFRAIKQDNIIYIKTRDIQDKYPSIFLFTYKLNINKLIAQNVKTEEIVFDNIPCILFQNGTYANSDYYIDIILPKITKLSQ